MALVDDVTIRIKAGDGGNGGRSFHQYFGSIKSHPDGGNGGRGGDVFFVGSANVSDLSEFRYKKVITAADGGRGMNKDMNGKKGDDATILVPLGTTLIDTKTQENLEILSEGNPVVAAYGGKGKSGNRDARQKGVSTHTEMGLEQKGERRELHLILNIIADIGLIGLPNAGKSSLLKTITRAEPKIGNYPFTTLEPNLGVLQLSGFSSQLLDKGLPVVSQSETEKLKTDNRFVLADIPGLVEGASQGKGLGIQFLKHILKTKVLFHCIDASSENPYEAYLTVRSEFEDYDKRLLEKKEIILLTKTDLVDSETLAVQVKKLKKTKKQIIPTSIYSPESMQTLLETIQSFFFS